MLDSPFLRPILGSMNFSKVIEHLPEFALSPDSSTTHTMSTLAIATHVESESKERRNEFQVKRLDFTDGSDE